MQNTLLMHELCTQETDAFVSYFRKNLDFDLPIVHNISTALYYTTCAQPRLRKALGSHFSWQRLPGPAALSWAALRLRLLSYSCHRRVWWPHEACHNVTWHASLSSSPIISGDILSWLRQLTWLGWLRSFSRPPGLSRPEPELSRIWELENLRAQSHRNFQSRDTRRGLFLFPSCPQFYGTNTRQVYFFIFILCSQW